MENRVEEAAKKVLVGYVETVEEANELVNKFGVYDVNACWALGYLDLKSEQKTVPIYSWKICKKLGGK